MKTESELMHEAARLAFEFNQVDRALDSYDTQRREIDRHLASVSGRAQGERDLKAWEHDGNRKKLEKQRSDLKTELDTVNGAMRQIREAMHDAEIAERERREQLAVEFRLGELQRQADIALTRLHIARWRWEEACDGPHPIRSQQIIAAEQQLAILEGQPAAVQNALEGATAGG